jgi:hypothetical protein
VDLRLKLDEQDTTWGRRPLKIRTANVHVHVQWVLVVLDGSARESYSSRVPCAATWPYEEILGGAILGQGMQK